MNCLWLAVDLALFFNQYVNPVALADIRWKYYIVYAVWLGFETYVVWQFYIETKNTPLEEIVKHFDGENALVGGTAATEKGRELEEQIEGAASSGLESMNSRGGHVELPLGEKQVPESEVKEEKK